MYLQPMGSDEFAAVKEALLKGTLLRNVRMCAPNVSTSRLECHHSSMLSLLPKRHAFGVSTVPEIMRNALLLSDRDAQDDDPSWCAQHQLERVYDLNDDGTVKTRIAFTRQGGGNYRVRPRFQPGKMLHRQRIYDAALEAAQQDVEGT